MRSWLDRYLDFRLLTAVIACETLFVREVGGPNRTIGCRLPSAAAQQLKRFLQHRWLAGFRRGAAPAVVGLLGGSALSIAKQSFAYWAYALIAVIALGLAPVTFSCDPKAWGRSDSAGGLIAGMGQNGYSTGNRGR
jgi:hypothetical protein